MKIAISATGPSLDADVDPRFGRCQYFIIVDPDTMEFEAVENANLVASSGVGVASGQMIANKGVQVVLTGNCGPNAYQTLTAAGVQVISGVTGKIPEAIEGYKAGRFQTTSQPTGAAYSGMGRGMGAGMMTSPPPTPQSPGPGQELEALAKQIQMLGQQLNEVLRRLEKLEEK